MRGYNYPMISVFAFLMALNSLEAQKIKITLFNSSEKTLSEIYLSQTEEEWGSNLVSKNKLKFEEEKEVSIKPSGKQLWSLMVVDNDGKTSTISDLELFDKCVVEIFYSEGSYEIYIYDPNEEQTDEMVD